jgi:hypothetical protein
MRTADNLTAIYEPIVLRQKCQSYAPAALHLKFLLVLISVSG